MGRLGGRIGLGELDDTLSNIRPKWRNASRRARKPFTWTAHPDKIIAAVRRGHQVLDSIH